MKPTAQMKKALTGMLSDNRNNGSAYGLRVSIATMRALCDRGLVNPVSSTGWSFSPQTCYWTLTNEGRIAAYESQCVGS